MAIINFITKYRFHNYVKGREMWQKAEAAQVCVPVYSGSFTHFICIVPRMCIFSLRHFQDFSVLHIYHLHLELVITLYTVTLEKYILGKNCVCNTTAILFFKFLHFVTDLCK